MKIRTTVVCPPIPVRQFDWSAIDDDTYDGAEDSATRGQIGYGATEEEAVSDLMEILADRTIPASECCDECRDAVKAREVKNV